MNFVGSDFTGLGMHIVRKIAWISTPCMLDLILVDVDDADDDCGDCGGGGLSLV